MLLSIAALQEIRLKALRECPEAFGSSYEEECAWDNAVYEGRIKSGECAYFGAFEDGGIVGIIGLAKNARIKTRHKAALVLFFVSPNSRRRGIGAGLIRAAIEKAIAQGTIEQIELSAVTGQAAAIALYKGAGFEIYGEEYRALKIDGRYRDEFLMMKRLH